VVAPTSTGRDIQLDYDTRPAPLCEPAMSWALQEFFAAVEDEFGVTVGNADAGYLETPGAVIDFVIDNSSPSDGMAPDEYREHVAGIIGEIMARTLGVTRYTEGSRFVQDLRVR
jgi:hypothetical protein